MIATDKPKLVRKLDKKTLELIKPPNVVPIQNNNKDIKYVPLLILVL